MFTFETVVPAGRAAQRISTAFYRYLERQAVNADELPRLRLEPDGRFERITVILWSEDAIREFRSFLEAQPAGAPGGLSPPRRYDDLM